MLATKYVGDNMFYTYRKHVIFLSSITTGLESRNLFLVQFSASNNALAAESFFSLHIISNSKCCCATLVSHFAIFSLSEDSQWTRTGYGPLLFDGRTRFADPWPCSSSIWSFLLSISSFRTSIPNRIRKRSFWRSTMSGNRLLFRRSKSFRYQPLKNRGQ